VVDSVIRETTKVFSYQPGKSLLVLNTFVMNSPKENLRQRVGYFGADNGMYLQVSEYWNGTTR
jgi:hydrogenase-4 membrane subunit HyfE